MRKELLVFLGSWALQAPPIGGVDKPGAAPTFYRDVLPVLQNRCQTCHRAGEAVPMAFGDYRDTRPWAKAIREAVLSRKMPPWFADPAHGSFANDRRLPQAEINTVAAWVDAGAPQGDPADAPPPRQFTEGWAIGNPDLVLAMPEPFAVPASGTIDYQYVLVPTYLADDRWVEKVEVRPGNRSVVHHVVAFTREPGSKFMRSLQPGVPFAPSRPKSRPPANNDAGVFVDTAGSEVLGVYVPGGVPYQLGPGQARLLRAGSDLVLQMHYTASGAAATDRTRVGIIFARQPPLERVRNMVVGNPYLRIPPGAADFPVTARVMLAAGTRLVSMFPHMHVRGKAFEYRARYPDGRTEVLLAVPRYDFNWQLTYYLDRPKSLPKGTVLECLARYDNSPDNPANPDPTAEVAWGDQTWEEMLAGFVDLAFEVGSDPEELLHARQLRAPPERP